MIEPNNTNKNRYEDNQVPQNNTENTSLPAGEENLEADATMDLDGDGMIGNTGGFYGGTSYLGSNYGPDWTMVGSTEKEGTESNFGAGGMRDDTPLTGNDQRDEDTDNGGAINDQGRITPEDRVI